MLLIDRYIIRQFTVNFLILLFVLMSLFVLIDLMFDLDEFVAAARWRLEQNQVPARRRGAFVMALLWTIMDYHGPTLVLVYVFLAGLLVVAAMGFTFNGLVRNRELMAVVTSGVSMYRVAEPLLVVGIALSFLALPIQEFVIPELAHKLARSKRHLKRGPITRYPIRYQPDGQGNLFCAEQYDAEGKVLTGLTVRQVDKEGRLIRRISADEAVWDPHLGGWRLAQGHATGLADSTTDIVAVDHSLDESIEFFATDLSPQVLMARRASIYPRLLSLSGLHRLASNSNVDRRQIRQIMHSRFSLLVINALILVMAMPFFLLREPANLLRQAIKAAAVCMAAFFLGVVVMQLGTAYLNPVASAWLPVVLYLPISAALLQTIRT